MLDENCFSLNDEETMFSIREDSGISIEEIKKIAACFDVDDVIFYKDNGKLYRCLETIVDCVNGTIDIHVEKY